MSAQLMRHDRPAYDKAITGGGTSEQMAAAAAGYPCYSGPFTLSAEVQPRKGVSSTHVLVWRRARTR